MLRVNSHASAGSRTVPEPQAPCPAAIRPTPPPPPGVRIPKIRLALHGARGVAAPLLCGSRPQWLRCNALQQIDYTFYQEMSPSDVNVDYLWGRLEPLLQYLTPEDRTEVLAAMELAFKCHDKQLRKSGEPFITHPVEVTRILAELKLGKESLIAGLLHDSVEDTDHITFERIEELFGFTVRRIVEGETKFSKIGRLADIDNSRNVDVKAVDLQQLFLSMTEEVRIILVKLADRLHNLRTLGSMPPHKQKRIADETLQIFAPLARLLGLFTVKEELEERSFRYSDPDSYFDLKRRMDTVLQEQGPVVREAQRALETTLSTDLYLQMRVSKIEVYTSKKGLYSMHRKLKSFEAEHSNGERAMLGSTAQLRIVLHEKEGKYDELLYGSMSQMCYHVLGLVHSTWAPIPGKMKDYIATPKSNGYQSLHTTVLPLGSSDLFPLEVQICTQKMHQLAEYGIAAEGWASPFVQHRRSFSELAYDPIDGKEALSASPKQLDLNGSARPVNNGIRLPDEDIDILVQSSKWGNLRMNTEVMNRRINWLNSIREWQEEFLDLISAREFVDTVTGDLLGQRVFVFTPAGEVMHLPKGATVVDFAYHVHTGVGNHMVAAKVNGNLVSPSHELNNAEVVEILTYSAAPNAATMARHREFFQHAKTRSARYKITKFMRSNRALVVGDIPELIDSETGSSLEDSPNASADSCSLDDVALASSGTAWLIVECQNKNGLLAEITTAISCSGHSITEYSGSFDKARGIFVMNFVICGDQGTIPEMCHAISMKGFVRHWAVGCRVSPWAEGGGQAGKDLLS
mmetsp:Transcript_934/g.2883  ORF Transcript_934/g.2883 Transcript_934/m.2883 type:complete len:802 (+) Transcript_934:372-2777(+)